MSRSPEQRRSCLRTYRWQEHAGALGSVGRVTQARALLVLALSLPLVAGGPGEATLLGPRVAHAASRIFRNPSWRISSFEVPRAWVQASQQPWPGVLLVAAGNPSVGTREARLVLAAQRVIPGQEPLELAADARVALLRQGFIDPRVTPRSNAQGGAPRCQIDATLDRGLRVMRQVYVVSSDIAYVVTVTAPVAAAGPALRAFDAAVDSLEIDPPPSPAPPPS